ncbi:carbamoyltransferase, partial [Streptomyces sp. S9]|nr:carbamoyltransferase [Streptomyces sp. S9]
EAAVLTVDGVGEWATTSYCVGAGKELTLFEEVAFPDSLGLFYSTITSFLGLKVNSGEYKVMGLAPYGKEIYVDRLKQLIQAGENGQYRLDMRYFDFLRTSRMYSDALIELMGIAPRVPESDIDQVHMDIAKSLQVVLEEILLDKVRYLHGKVPSKNLCMAGGVALNCVANGKILREGPFENLFVQPAAGDAGSALGAAA